MLPKGLVLLISIALTTGVIKLAKKDLESRYVRDRDTGPCRYPLFRQNRHLTEGRLSVESIQSIDDTRYNGNLRQLFGCQYRQQCDDARCAKPSPDLRHYQSFAAMPFSSDRKWGCYRISRIRGSLPRST